MRKVIVAMLKHETNNFLPFKTYAEDYTVLRGKEIYDKKHSRFSGPRGIISELSKEADIEIIPTVFCNAIPGGPVENNFYNNVKEEIKKSIIDCGKPDGIVLDLHGSMITENHPDTEGDLLEEIKSISGDAPIVASLDMHATITDKMLENLSAIAGYHTAPHTDVFETGQRAAAIMKKILSGENICMISTKIPFIVAGEKSETDSEPMKGLIKSLKEEIVNRRIIDGSIFLGFPWADNYENNANLIVVSELKYSEYGKNFSERLSNLLWEKRKEFEFSTSTFNACEAVEKAFLSKKYGIFVSDCCDNPTAASAGDNTNLLREFVEYKKNNAAVNDMEITFSAIFDEQAVNKCIEAGIGALIALSLGGKIDSKFSEPLEITGIVKKIAVNYRDSLDMVLFESNGINIFISSKRFAVASEWKIFEEFGIDVSTQKAIGIKCGYLSMELKNMASESYFALAKGYTNQILEEIEYKKLTRPIYPLDELNFFRPVSRILKNP